MLGASKLLPRKLHKAYAFSRSASTPYRGFTYSHTVRHGAKGVDDDSVPKCVILKLHPTKSRYTVNWILKDGSKISTKEKEGRELGHAC